MPDIIFTSGYYLFSNGTYDVLLRPPYIKHIKLIDATQPTYMFEKSKVEDLSQLEITMKSGTVTKTGDRPITCMFSECNNLKKFPKITGPISYIGAAFYNCYNLTTEEYNKLFTEATFVAVPAAGTPLASTFTGNYRVRDLTMPLNYIQACYEKQTTVNSNNIFYRTFMNCYMLDSITNLPVDTKSTCGSSAFQTSFNSCYRLKDLICCTNNGTPYIAKWTGVLDLSSYVGWANSVSASTMQSYGLPSGKQVTNSSNYQTLKNDPDWWTNNFNYSRYNHDSAVRTINSLPDNSAYLTSAGKTMTIKFKGASGKNTDGGAINTLTSSEIAVATAKGWTVSFV